MIDITQCAFELQRPAQWHAHVLTDQRHDRLAVNLVGGIGERRCFRKSGDTVEPGNAARENVDGLGNGIFPSVLELGKATCRERVCLEQKNPGGTETIKKNKKLRK